MNKKGPMTPDTDIHYRLVLMFSLIHDGGNKYWAVTERYEKHEAMCIPHNIYSKQKQTTFPNLLTNGSNC